MNTKDILYHLRTERGLSQDELAAKIFVTRQAVSRWETGETTPNVETLKLLSAFFNVSINTLLGSPRQLICQCCGMPQHWQISCRGEPRSVLIDTLKNAESSLSVSTFGVVSPVSQRDTACRVTKIFAASSSCERPLSVLR